MEDVKLNRSQQRVFDYLRDFGSITSLQAIADLGETRVGARIWELRRKGLPVESEMISVANRYGERRRVKRYFMAGGGGWKSAH